MSTKRKKTTPKNQNNTKDSSSASVFEQVYQIVLQIPPSKVMTYGQISLLLGERLSAAGVGWAMSATPNDERKIPWHRVINSRGGISTNKILNVAPNLQKNLLEAEGLVFNEQGFIDLKTYQWKPETNK